MSYTELVNFIEYYNQLDDGIDFNKIQNEMFKKKVIDVNDNIDKQILLDMYFNE